MSSTNDSTRRSQGLPINRMIIIFGVVGALASRHGRAPAYRRRHHQDIPIVGNGKRRKLWRIVFRPDKTIASFPVPRNQARPLREGRLLDRLFWNAMVKLDDGKTYTATLMAETPIGSTSSTPTAKASPVLERASPAPNPGFAERSSN